MSRIELLGDRNKGDVVLLEGLHHPGKVHEGARKSINFVDDHAVDLTRLDVS